MARVYALCASTLGCELSLVLIVLVDDLRVELPAVGLEILLVLDSWVCNFRLPARNAISLMNHVLSIMIHDCGFKF